MRAIGLMSGTSMDGIDIALVDTDGEAAVQCGPVMAVPYDAGFRRAIEAGLTDAAQIEDRIARPGDLAELERAITLRHAEGVRAFLNRHALAPDNIDIIGFHGQTVLHRPEKALTVQLGDGALLAAETGIAVVHDMRANDMAHGGQGAPLVPAWHAALARALPSDRRAFPAMIVNIGGIANVTWVPEIGDPVAFDCGPGNALIDQWLQTGAGVPFDQAGMVGSEGAIVRTVVERYLADPFFDRPAPKSLDRGDFTLDAASDLELADGARTLAAVTAESIFTAADLAPARPRLWVLSGGGRLNPNIVKDLKALVEADGAHLLLAEEAGLDGDMMEAQAWAYLAVRALRRLPLTWPATTGCDEAVSGGIVTRPPQT